MDEPVESTVDWVTLNDSSSDSIQLIGGQLHMLDVLMDRDRERLFSGWELAEVVGLGSCPC